MEQTKDREADETLSERDALDNVHACIGDADQIQLDRALRDYKQAVINTLYSAKKDPHDAT